MRFRWSRKHHIQSWLRRQELCSKLIQWFNICCFVGVRVWACLSRTHLGKDSLQIKKATISMYDGCGSKCIIEKKGRHAIAYGVGKCFSSLDLLCWYFFCLGFFRFFQRVFCSKPLGGTVLASTVGRTSGWKPFLAGGGWADAMAHAATEPAVAPSGSFQMLKISWLSIRVLGF